MAWRNILRSKMFSAINVFDLVVGMTCCMLLWLYIRSESNYNQHHHAAEDLYLVSSEAITTGGKEEFLMLSAPYAGALQSEFPEVAQVTRLLTHSNEDKTLFQLIEAGIPVQSFYESKRYCADSIFFDLLSYRCKEDDPVMVLRDNSSVVLSEAVASKFFGAAPVLHKIIPNKGSTVGEI